MSSTKCSQLDWLHSNKEQQSLPSHIGGQEGSRPWKTRCKGRFAIRSREVRTEGSQCVAGKTHRRRLSGRRKRTHRGRRVWHPEEGRRVPVAGEWRNRGGVTLYKRIKRLLGTGPRSASSRRGKLKGDRGDLPHRQRSAARLRGSRPKASPARYLCRAARKSKKGSEAGSRTLEVSSETPAGVSRSPTDSSPQSRGDSGKGTGEG